MSGDEREPVLSFHPVSCKIDAQSWLRDLCWDLLQCGEMRGQQEGSAGGVSSREMRGQMNGCMASRDESSGWSMCSDLSHLWGDIYAPASIGVAESVHQRVHRMKFG